MTVGFSAAAMTEYPDPCTGPKVTPVPGDPYITTPPDPDPSLLPKPADCDLMYYKIDLNQNEVDDGDVFTSNGFTVTIFKSPDAPIRFAFESNYNVMHVYAKGGPDGGNLYMYYPTFENGVKSDCGLVQTGPGGGWSHISFYYCEPKDTTIDVDVTAEGKWEIEYEWDIEKSVVPDEWHLFKGDTGTSEYTVAVTKSEAEGSDVRTISGVVSVENTGMYATQGLSVRLELWRDGSFVDAIDPVIGVADIAAGGSTGNIAYLFSDVDFTGDPSFEVKAIATIDNGPQDDESALVSEVALTVIGYNQVNISDSFKGLLGQVSDSATFTYSRTFDCDCEACFEEGGCTFDNTATIIETDQYDSASVDVYCYELDLTKDADTYFERDYFWTIDKVGDQLELVLSEGQVFAVNYMVTVDATYEDSAFAVSGKIYIHNPAPMNAVINSISDVIFDGINADIDFAGAGVTFPYTLAAGETLELEYTADLPDAVTRLNTATAVQQNYDYDKDFDATPDGTTSYSGTADVIFGDPNVENDKCIDVVDDVMGPLGTVCFDIDTLPKTFNYSMDIGPFYLGDEYECGGYYQVMNVATFTGDCGGTGSDGWAVSWTIPCPGCTLTPGYWKTHSSYGPAPYDETWALLGEDTSFFDSGKTYYQALWTPPAGNPYYILAHAYIAAELNFLNEASYPTAVMDAFIEASYLFSEYTPAEVLALPRKSADRAMFTTLATILDDYNNGLTGPGHCSDDMMD
jgi:hypothetical protein